MSNNIEGNRGPQGFYQPEFRNQQDTPLSYEQMDYNLALIGQIIGGYRVMGTGPDGDLSSSDVEKVLKLYRVTSDDTVLLTAGAEVDDLVWVPSIATGGSGEGTQGPQGPQGPAGANGVDGSQGYQGVQGIEGVQGYQGVQGIEGPQGYQGYQGVQGYQGYQGYQGIEGTQGYQGVAGIDGVQGYQGLIGPQGDSIAGTSKYLLRLEYDATGTLIPDSTTFVDAPGFSTIGAQVVSQFVGIGIDDHTVTLNFTEETSPPSSILVYGWQPLNGNYIVSHYGREPGSLAPVQYLTGSTEDNFVHQATTDGASGLDGQWGGTAFSSANNYNINILVDREVVKYGDAFIGGFFFPSIFPHAYLILTF